MRQNAGKIIICALLAAAVLALSLAVCAGTSGVSAKLAPVLARSGKSESTRQRVLVVTRSGMVSAGTRSAGARSVRGLPRAVAVYATPAEMHKMASDDNVLAIVPDDPPPVPPVPGPQFHTQIQPVSDEPAPLPNTYLASEIVGAQAAWDLGFTGRGVKVAVLDTGIDFAHPDLQNTQARVEDPDSPYYGWPIVFDPYSMAYYGETGRTITTSYCSTFGSITEDNPYIGSIRYELPHTSQSGTYRVGVHPSYRLRWYPPSSRSAIVLLADERVAGIYDTVYVDLDKDADFTDEKPCFRGDEIAWHDVDGDGLADLSGGMVYFIADGVSPIPASDWLYGLPPPANGSLVCFAGAFDKDENHGTLVTSAIVSQGVIGRDEPYELNGSGIVVGTAPDARIIAIGSVYKSGASMYDAVLFAALGYDGLPNTGDEADIANMSFGYSTIENDGWDYLSRYISYINAAQAQHTTYVSSTGNGGPGYGTVTSPASSPSVISVGASTLYGSVPYFDDIASAEQILYGDIQPWSNRGPSAVGAGEPDVVAVGAWATGDVPLYGSGDTAWMVWGGTSLSAPMACGVLATAFEAYYHRTGNKPTFDIAKDLLMAGARDLGYPVLEQGGGQVDAERSALVAAGSSFSVSPSSWRVGSDYQGFLGTASPGDSCSTRFTVENPTAHSMMVELESETLIRLGRTVLPVEVRNSEESLISSVDYLVDLLPYIPQGTELLRVRADIPFDQFSLSDPATRDMAINNAFALILYDWTDVNSNGLVWHDDVVPNGVVNEDELDELELNRFTYDAPAGNCLEASLQNPLSRYHDGLFLGIQHYLGSDAIPITDIKITLDFYAHSKWKAVQVSPRKLRLRPHSKRSFTARFRADRYQTPGVYGGAIRASSSMGDEQLIPVTACVTNGPRSWMPGTLHVWGSDWEGAPYDNGAIGGAVDWGWRAETGDWRTYFYDPPDIPEGNARLLTNVRWRNYPTDIDVMLFGPNREDYFSQQLPGFFGPYALSPAGASRATNLGTPVWSFFTNSGITSEWVSAPLSDGTHLALLHCVLSSGQGATEPMGVGMGPVVVNPSELEVPAGEPSSAPLTMTPYLYLWGGAAARAYGFSTPIELANQTARQDPQDSPDSASWLYDLQIDNAGLLEVSTASTDDIDIDLYLVRDINGDGFFDWDNELVDLSGDASPNESISITLPEDGRYRVAVHGYRVSRPATFSVSINAIQGSEITVQSPPGLIWPGWPAYFQAEFNPQSGAQPGAGEGIIFLGPAEAPTAIDIRVHAR